MNIEEKIALLKAREYIVAKSNQIVQKARYDFTVNEQKTIAYICSMIKPIDPKNKTNELSFVLDYEFNILDYSRICGIQDNGRVYEECKKLLKRLRDKSMWLNLGDGSETVVSWLDRVTTNKRSGLAKIRIDDRLVPYLFNLQEKYLSYGLKNIILMKSQYSLRLYELLKSLYDMNVSKIDHELKSISLIFELNELKKQLMVDTIKSYHDYGKFRQKVLEIAQKEINEMTDINFFFEPILKGRKTIKVKCTITCKNTIDRYLTGIKNDKKLGDFKK